MQDLINKHLANGFSGFKGIRIEESLPVTEGTINELIMEIGLVDLAVQAVDGTKASLPEQTTNRGKSFCINQDSWQAEQSSLDKPVIRISAVDPPYQRVFLLHQPRLANTREA